MCPNVETETKFKGKQNEGEMLTEQREKTAGKRKIKRFSGC